MNIRKRLSIIGLLLNLIGSILVMLSLSPFYSNGLSPQIGDGNQFYDVIVKRHPKMFIVGVVIFIIGLGVLIYKELRYE
jgi:hypothetical protein